MSATLYSLGEHLRTSLQSGSIFAVLAAFAFGVFVGFTPCVYPILPITVAYIGSIARGSKINGFIYSLIYVLGMAIVYSAIGVITAITGSQIGRIWNNGWALLALANFFIFLALWQLKVIQISMPQIIQSASPRRRGALGALLVGGASGLVVGPCTLPGLAAMVTLVGASARAGSAGSLIFGAAAMFAYSLGLGGLVIVCGTFSAILTNLPRSGAWLNAVEKTFAMLLIAVAECFLIYLGQNAKFPLLSSLTAPNTPAAVGISPAPATARTGSGAVVGNPAPDWRLNDLAGKPVALGDYRGKKGVLMAFFATWCAACMEEVPGLTAFQSRYDGRPVELIGVDYDQPAQVVKQFAEARKVNYKLVLDPDGAVATAYGVVGFPTFVGIDAAGTIRYVDNALPGDLDPLVKQLETGGAAEVRQP
jgi:thiol:disulfide interchange protein DsbD